MVIVKNIEYSDEEFIDIVKSSYSIAEICRKVNILPYGGNYKVIYRKILELDINTDHMTGQGWNTGDKKIGPKLSLDEILVKNSKYSSYKLGRRLIKEGIKEHKCECCGNTVWLDQPIKLELHHINGDSTDNRLENLQLLCPNCHSYTDNYRGRKKKK